MLKGRAILKNGEIILGVIDDIRLIEGDVMYSFRTAAPKPNDMVSVFMFECRKITITDTGHANSKGDERAVDEGTSD